jgi:hypothetical protein
VLGNQGFGITADDAKGVRAAVDGHPAIGAAQLSSIPE